MVETLTVNLGERSYPIRFGVDLSGEVRGEVAALRAAGRKVAVLTDGNLVRAQGPALTAMFGEAPTLAVEAGEGAKSLTGLGRVLDFLAEQKLDRGGVLFAAGGGVMGDLGGFAAAAWLRGIDFFQVPTTLLAMVDSSVGGKTGINIAAGKNLVGAFHQPRGVFVATGLLATLPAREFAAGMAEVIKYGLLGDPELLAQLERAPLTVASAEFQRLVRLRRRPVDQIRMVLRLGLQVDDGALGLAQDVIPPGHQLVLEIGELPLIHERLVVRRSVGDRFVRHDRGQCGHRTHTLEQRPPWRTTAYRQDTESRQQGSRVRDHGKARLPSTP